MFDEGSEWQLMMNDHDEKYEVNNVSTLRRESGKFGLNVEGDEPSGLLEIVYFSNAFWCSWRVASQTHYCKNGACDGCSSDDVAT